MGGGGRILFVCFLSKVLYSYTFKKAFPKESSTTKLEVDWLHLNFDIHVTIENTETIICVLVLMDRFYCFLNRNWHTPLNVKIILRKLTRYWNHFFLARDICFHLCLNNFLLQVRYSLKQELMSCVWRKMSTYVSKEKYKACKI